MACWLWLREEKGLSQEARCPPNALALSMACRKYKSIFSPKFLAGARAGEL